MASWYERHFLKGRLGFGFKSAYVTSSNDFEQYDITGDTRLKDTLHSNNFDYKEQINAV